MPTLHEINFYKRSLFMCNNEINMILFLRKMVFTSKSVKSQREYTKKKVIVIYVAGLVVMLLIGQKTALNAK